MNIIYNNSRSYIKITIQLSNRNYQTLIVFSESVSSPNHTKFVPKLKGIEWEI